MKLITRHMTDQLDVHQLGQLFIRQDPDFVILNLPVREYTLDEALQSLTKKNGSKNLIRKMTITSYILNKI